MPAGRPRRNGDALIKSAEMLGWALGGIEREIGQTRDRLAALTAQAAKLRTRLGLGRGKGAVAGAAAEGDDAAAPRRKRKRGKMSAEARKRMSEMMRKRWAETKKSGKRRLGASR